MRLRCIWMLLFTCCCWLLLPGQERIYRNYTVKDGLPSNNVYSAMQDHNGYIWFCTDAGVSRFDGKQFKNFTVRDGLLDNEVFNCTETDDGKIVFNSHKRGICYYENGRFYSPAQQPWLAEKKLPSSFIVADKAGNIWCNIVANLTSVYRVSFREKLIERVDNRKGAPFIYVYNGIVDSMAFEDYAWMQAESIRLTRAARRASVSGSAAAILEVIFKESAGWAPQRRKLSHIRFLMSFLGFYEEFLSLRTIRNALVGADSTMVVFTNNEGTLYYPRLPAPGVVPQVFLPGKTIANIMRDSESNTWVTTMNEGAFLFRSNETWSYNALLPVKPVYSLNIYKNSLLVGQEDRVGLLQQHRYQSIWQGGQAQGKTSYMGLYNRVKDMQPVTDGRVFLATDLGIYSVPPGRGNSGKLILPTSIKDLCIRKKGGVYFSFHNGTGYVDAFDNTDNWKFVRRTTSVYEDERGFVWVGSPEGLLQKKGDSLAITSLVGGPARANIISIDGTGPYIFAASSGSGCYIIRNNTWVNISNDVSLPPGQRLNSNICRRVMVKNDHAFWLCTNAGLNLVEIDSWQPFTYHISSFTMQDGLLSNDLYDVRELDGRVWVGTGNGLCAFLEKDMYKKDLPPRITVLNGTDISDKAFASGTRLAFEFGGVSLESMGDISYHYRLLGLSAGWDTTREAAVQYGQLPFGDYEMQVYAVSRSGVRSREYASVPFTILKPWWRRSSSLALFGVALLLLLLFIIRQVAVVARRRERKKQEHLNQLQQLEMKALRSQMNPHFIFNSMNSVQKYVLTNDAEAACRYISAFASLIRQVLENARYSFVTLQKEISLLEAYMQLEQQRFRQKFSYEIEVAAGVQPAALQLPPMLIQPFVENAIWHGIQQNNGDGKIRISFAHAEQDVLRCTVEDNGVGRSATTESGTAEHRSLGVSITGQRLDILNGAKRNGVHIRYSIPDEGSPFPGTRVEIFIVCNNTRNDKSSFN